MILWIVLTAMIAAASAALAVALTHRVDAHRDRPGEAEALRGELAELDAQVGAGVLPARTAEALRTETLRRFLGQDQVPATSRPPLGRGAQMALAVGVSLALALGAAGLYARLGRPDLAAPAATAAPQGDRAQQVAALIPQLEAKVRAHPDATGLRLLGGAYMGVGRYREASDTFARLAALDPKDADARSAEGEAQVRAASGVVGAPASQAFQAALAVDPADPRARYFLGLRKEQQGDHAGAMDDWIALLKSAPPGAPWAGQVRAFIEQSASDHHEDVSARLPPEAPPPGEAASVSPAMVAGMVERLDARLKAQPRDIDGWVMLMRARMVLGQGEAATQALRRGMAAFAGSPADQARLAEAAQSLKVPGA